MEAEAARKWCEERRDATNCVPTTWRCPKTKNWMINFHRFVTHNLQGAVSTPPATTSGRDCHDIIVRFIVWFRPILLGEEKKSKYVLFRISVLMSCPFSMMPHTSIMLWTSTLHTWTSDSRALDPLYYYSTLYSTGCGGLAILAPAAISPKESFHDIEKKQKTEVHKQCSACEEFRAHSVETTTKRSS
jgi:hypothetical protein